MNENIKLPRGVANFNPGNVRLNDTRWQGQIDGNDSAFCVFDTPEDGIRALGKILINYKEKHGLDTVANIIARWAPATENNTLAYAQDVARRMAVRLTERLDLRNPLVLRGLCNAIIAHENSNFCYPAAVVTEGVRRALS